MHQWMLDEHAHAGSEHLDAQYVTGYEVKAGFDPGPEVDELRRHGLDDESTVVDLGAGTGVFTEAVASRCKHVTAVDVSPAMVDALGAKLVRQQITNVSVVQAGFLSYEHAGAPADIVFTRHALHQIPDLWKAVALSRIAAILRPGGILRVLDLIYDLEPPDLPAAMDEWIAGGADDSSRGWTPAELAEHVRTEHSTFRWLFEPVLDHAGFDILDASYQRRLYGAYTCRRREWDGRFDGREPRS